MVSQSSSPNKCPVLKKFLTTFNIEEVPHSIFLRSMMESKEEVIGPMIRIPAID